MSIRRKLKSERELVSDCIKCFRNMCHSKDCKDCMLYHHMLDGKDCLCEYCKLLLNKIKDDDNEDIF